MGWGKIKPKTEWRNKPPQLTTPHLFPVISPEQVLLCTSFESEKNLSSQLGPKIISSVNHYWYSYFNCFQILTMKIAQALTASSYRMPGISRAPGSSGQALAAAAAGTCCQTAVPAMIHLSLAASAPEMDVLVLLLQCKALLFILHPEDTACGN